MFGWVILLALVLILTIVIETTVAYIMGYRERNMIYVVALASVITNPVLNIFLLVTRLFSDFFSGYTILIMLELIIVYVEFRILRFVFGKRISNKKLFILSLAMNASSFIIGEFLSDRIMHMF